MDRLARAARWFATTPAAQLLLGGIVAMLVFPASPTGTIGRLVVFAALGIAVARSWDELPRAIRAPSPGQGTAIALAIVGIIGVAAYYPVLAYSPSPEWQTGDWGPQNAVLAQLMPHFPGLDMPVWNHAVSTGDAPLELYPALTYIFTGHLAWLLGLEGDLPHAFMITAVLVQLGLALTTTAVAARVAPRPIAVIIGLFWLVDSGALSHGGANGLFKWALLHSAFAHVFSMIAVLGILAALTRPRLGASLTIWVATAIATAAHPAALITAATCGVGLAAVALLAGDVKPRRAFAALAHLAIGVLLGACVWMPAAERLLAYGQHYPNELYDSLRTVQMLLQFAMPMTSYALIVFTSYLGILFGPWTRRAEVIFISTVAFVMLLGLCEDAYLAFGLAPGKAIARLGVIRIMMLARPFTYACAAFIVGVLWSHVRTAWAPVKRPRWVAAAVLGILVGTFMRVAPVWWSAETDRVVGEANNFTPDLEGQLELEAWARGEMERMTPNAWGRALFETTTHEHMHLTARTGLPSFHTSPIPDLLLRERIEDVSEASLRRFNVRWAVAAGTSPQLGDPATERAFGSYRVREIPGWDGKLARIERGQGDVQVVRIADDVVEIDVKAPGPVLVALGMGFYPRWRATHASGASESVFALPTIDGGKLHVVAAWVAPGRTTFTCDGELPSDGRGRILSLLAALVALAIVIAWSVTVLRVRTLRRMAVARRWLVDNTGRVLELTVPFVVAMLLVFGLVLQRGPAGAILVGSSGVRAVADVEARTHDGEWQSCGFSPVTGAYRCPDIVSVSDGTANILNDAPPSWDFITPAIVATPEATGVEVRIKRSLRLGGVYWVGASSGTAKLEVGSDFAHEFSARSTMEIPRGTYTITLTAKVPDGAALSLSLVEQSKLVPARPFLAPPPSVPPASVTSIR